MIEYSKAPTLLFIALSFLMSSCIHRSSKLQSQLTSRPTNCGGKPAYSDSVKDCNQSIVIKDALWQLVRKEANSHEIWADATEATQPIVWGESSKNPMTLQEAAAYCKDQNSKHAFSEENFCTWILPDFNHYSHAEVHGIRSLLPNMKHLFWTSTYSSPFSVFLFDGTYAALKESDVKPNKKHYVRCICTHVNSL